MGRRGWVWIGLVALGCAAPAESTNRPPRAEPEPCPDPEVRWAGACIDPTGGRASSRVIQQALDALPEAVGLGAVLELPANAILRLDDPDGDGVALAIRGRVILEGRGARLDVPAGVTALRVLPGASWSSVRDLRIVGPGRDSATVGVDVRGHGLRLDNLWLQGLGQAVQALTRIAGGACRSDDDCPEGACEDEACTSRVNVNSQQWGRVLIRNCGAGVRLQGGDANGGLIEGLEVLGTPTAIQDSSMLGNVYVAPLVESGSEVSLDLRSRTQYSTVVGAYVERNSARIQTAARTLLVGGNAVSFMDGPGERVGFRASRLRFVDLESRLRIDIPGSRGAITWRHPEDPSVWELRRLPGPSGPRWGFSRATDADAALLLPVGPTLEPAPPPPRGTALPPVRGPRARD